MVYDKMGIHLPAFDGNSVGHDAYLLAILHDQVHAGLHRKVGGSQCLRRKQKSVTDFNIFSIFNLYYFILFISLFEY